MIVPLTDWLFPYGPAPPDWRVDWQSIQARFVLEMPDLTEAHNVEWIYDTLLATSASI